MKRTLLLASIAFIPALAAAQSATVSDRPIVVAQAPAAEDKEKKKKPDAAKPAQQKPAPAPAARQPAPAPAAPQAAKPPAPAAPQAAKPQQPPAAPQAAKPQPPAARQPAAAQADKPAAAATRQERKEERRQERRDDRQQTGQAKPAQPAAAQNDKKPADARQDEKQRREQRQDARQDRREEKKDQNKEAQQERRQEQKDVQKDRREERKDVQQDQRKDAQQDRRRDERQDKREVQQDRREDQREVQQDRREGRQQEAREERREDRRLDALRAERRETREGNRTVIRERDRTIVRQGNRTIVRHDDDTRFRRAGADIRVNRRGAHTERVIVRPNGTRIVTVVDSNGRLIRRSRFVNGREYVLFTNRPSSGFAFIINVPPPVIRIPRERYIVEYRDAPRPWIYETLVAPPVMPIERAFSLDEVRYNYDVRARMPRIDIDSITFDTGSWDIRPDQAAKLEPIAEAMRRAIEENPNEVYMIEGHTDAVGTEDDNLLLSDRRAQAVAEVLTQEFNVPPENMIPQGYGEQNLKVDTGGPEERNRYVSVRRVTPLLAQQGTAAQAPRQ